MVMKKTNAPSSMLHKMCFLEVKSQCYFTGSCYHFCFNCSLPYSRLMIEEIEATEMISGISQKSYYLQGAEFLLELFIVTS